MLLKRLRDTMARAESVEVTLGEVVRLVANEMVAEVCSIYLLRAGEVLELFATQGLNPSAVHATRLRVGEGLVGDIAAHGRPLALDDAQHHPQFAYRPETGEEIYHSLAGVPIVRAGRVLGVLVVQNRTRRQYDEEEVETLQTIAMVLAELVSASHVVSPNEVQQVDGIGLLPLRVDGVQLTPGVAIGRAVLHEPRIVIQRVVAEDVEQEKVRFLEALRGVREDVDRMLEAHDMQSGEQREILETFRMFVDDRGWAERVREAIDSGLTAEAGVQRAFDDVRTRLGQSTDPYIRERLSDLQDLSNRLLLRLTGRVATDPSTLPDDMIVVARDMGPAELLDYDRNRLRGVVLEEGSALSHVAIVARALDIPVVGRAPNVLARVEAGDPIVVDGDNAQVLVRPAEDILQTVHLAIDARAERRRKYAALRDLPPATRDQARISLNMNAGLLIDMQHLDDTGADGVGLYRTEIPFMVRSEFPDVDAQAWLYGRVLDLADGRPVVFRTLDVGGDKVLPYIGAVGDENPAMGWRAIRIGPSVARHDPCRERAAFVDHVPHDRRGHRIATGASSARARTRSFEAARAARARESACRRHVRSTGAGMATRQSGASCRFHLDRHERSPAVPLCRRSRQYACRRPLRQLVPSSAATATFCSEQSATCGRGRCGVRRNGGTSGRGTRVAFNRHTLFVDVARRDRPREGDDSFARSK